MSMLPSLGDGLVSLGAASFVLAYMLVVHHFMPPEMKIFSFKKKTRPMPCGEESTRRPEGKGQLQACPSAR